MKTAMTLLAVVLLCLTTQASGERLIIDRVASVEAQDQALPTRGTRMEQVRRRYGKPAATKPAVGDPPITRWQYDEFTVYFEYDHVVHAVALQ